ncbi:DUF4276 family protein [Streptomyces sp. NA04227]|uniref:DUF4276 family protein n=1 Tax=Streptomyces sp. NA04227 TaxID=2742136 RepID=UPI00159223D7|nr:DUF4276 family protein [Streptomyces sp. NA04227]QKW09348.1 DUF4276 family protein [Streptomyces sp. NA04227]
MGLRYFSLALLTEGLSDQWFLLPLIDRQITSLEAASDEGFAFGGSGPGGCFTVAPRQRVVREVEMLLDHFDVVVLHQDHNERDKIDSVRKMLPHSAERVLGIVPVRETEAWMLADPDALPQSAATAVRELVAGPAHAEKVPDPKKALAQALGPRHQPEYEFDRLGQTVSLDIMERVPAYNRWVSDLKTVMKELRFL